MKSLVDATAAAIVTPDPTNAREAERLAKWRAAAVKAQATGKMANTLAKALAKRFSDRWQFVDFLGPKGRESAGVVDILAIRKSGAEPTVEGLKKLDAFDIHLIQVKGGEAPMPNDADKARLRLVQKHYHAHHIILFQWKVGETASFSVLCAGDVWDKRTALELFGTKSSNMNLKAGTTA